MVIINTVDAAGTAPRQDLYRSRNQETATITAVLGQTLETVSNPLLPTLARETNSAVDNSGG